MTYKAYASDKIYQQNKEGGWHGFLTYGGVYILSIQVWRKRNFNNNQSLQVRRSSGTERKKNSVLFIYEEKLNLGDYRYIVFGWHNIFT